MNKEIVRSRAKKVLRDTWLRPHTRQAGAWWLQNAGRQAGSEGDKGFALAMRTMAVVAADRGDVAEKEMAA